jgi:hypothetical protein
MSNPNSARRWICLWWPESRIAAFVSRREPDYPAAHSMDTTWYAVDAVGHVAVGFSYENGCVPLNSGDLGFFEMLRILRGDPKSEDEDDDSPDWEEVMDEAFDNGVFVFQFHEGSAPFLNPYSNDGLPARPLHVDQLPPRLRELFKRVCFENVRFAEVEILAIPEHVSCFFYFEEGDPDADLAFLAGDGKTLRPIPGREQRYTEFCQQVREKYPELLKSFVFDGSPVVIKKPAPKPEER